jgi:hypothetical protein
MELVSYSFDQTEFQAVINNCKDQLIDRLNKDHGLKLDPTEYVFVLRRKGCLGAAIDKLCESLGVHLKGDETQRMLVRVHKEKA